MLPKWLQTCAIEPEMCFYVPLPKRVHGIGAGAFSCGNFNRLSDATYRIFDYNRKEDGTVNPVKIAWQPWPMDAINFSDVQDDFPCSWNTERIQNEPR
ncbi:MAG: hypothetical protein ACLUHA_16245 [Bacteroides stercoris]